MGLKYAPSHILITDVRDVVFQDNPFGGIVDECLLFFSENSKVSLGQQSINWNWLTNAYGLAAVESLAPFPILCSGTVLGSYKCILRYLSDMTDELARLSPKIVGQFGFDQGALNYLYYSKSWPKAVVNASFYGPVATLALENPNEFNFDDDGRLLNNDGSIVPILHQYDRHEVLLTRCNDLLKNLAY